MQQKLSIPIHDENDSEKVDKEKIIRLKMGLNDDFKIRNMFDYNINLINKLNSGLFETFLFSSNQNIGEGDRLVFVEEFLPFTLQKNEECPEEDEDNQYIIIPNARYISIENLAKI